MHPDMPLYYTICILFILLFKHQTPITSFIALASPLGRTLQIGIFGQIKFRNFRFTLKCTQFECPDFENHFNFRTRFIERCDLVIQLIPIFGLNKCHVQLAR